MFCEKCGSELREGAMFCHACGWSVPEAMKSYVAPGPNDPNDASGQVNAPAYGAVGNFSAPMNVAGTVGKRMSGSRARLVAILAILSFFGYTVGGLFRSGTVFIDPVTYGVTVFALLLFVVFCCLLRKAPTLLTAIPVILLTLWGLVNYALSLQYWIAYPQLLITNTIAQLLTIAFAVFYTLATAFVFRKPSTGKILVMVFGILKILSMLLSDIAVDEYVIRHLTDVLRNAQELSDSFVAKTVLSETLTLVGQLAMILWVVTMLIIAMGAKKAEKATWQTPIGTS